MNSRSAVRLWLLTTQALREAAHLRLAWALAAAALALTGAATLLREFNFGAEEARFLCDMAEGALMLFGLLLAIALPVALFHLRSLRDSYGVLQMHGVRRHEWLLSRALASGVAVLWLALIVQCLLAVLLWRSGLVIPPAALAVAGGTSALRLMVVACLAVAMCSLCDGPLLAAILTLAFTLSAQLSPVIVWAQQRGSDAMRAVWRVLDWALPDFQSVGVSGFQLAYVSGYMALYLALACWTFSRREL